jgi:hypothetical protein
MSMFSPQFATLYPTKMFSSGLWDSSNLEILPRLEEKLITSVLESFLKRGKKVLITVNDPITIVLKTYFQNN